MSVSTPEGDEPTVTWPMIERVLVLTTDRGPFLPDVFWVIKPIDAKALIFPGPCDR